jgi:TolB-like protein/DNA-binding winged helix-turn-helix (wHTH) protein/Tfp pilus assembly protein PilF
LLCGVHGVATDTIAADQTFEFGSFRLDERKGTLDKGTEQIFLRPKAYGLLLHLARNMGRVVPKAELMDAVWPNTYVTEDSLTQSIREIRKALSDLEQQMVRTVSRRGYMLAGGRAEEPLELVASNPIVAVLRFRNEGGDPAREPIVDGFAEDVLTGLGHFGTLTVLARNSTFQFPSYEPTQWSSTASRIGADYLVEGSVRWSGTNAQVAVSLIDARNLRQLWGERYEVADIELFAVQREIGEQIVNRLVTRLDEDTIRRIATKPPQSLAAYELVVRGVAALRGASFNTPEDAVPFFERAIAKDPSYGIAYGFLALASIMAGGYGQAPIPVLEAAQAMATKAMELSPHQEIGPRVRSLARLHLAQFHGAEADIRLALDLNRYSADAIEHMGWLLVLRGKPLPALAWIDRAIRLDPLHPAFYHYARGLAFYGLAEYENAKEAFERPTFLPPWVAVRLAACYAQLGDAVGARRNIERAMAINPNYQALWHARERIPYEHAADAEHLAEGIEAALGYAA